MNQELEQIAERLTQERINELQQLVNDLRTTPQYKRYVEQRQLHLINSELLFIDNLLKKGIII